MQLITNRSLHAGTVVIAQMFEWNWDSVAAECTSFLGPAGYGFVQGKVKRLSEIILFRIVDAFSSYFSEPRLGTRSRSRMVDGLSARIVHPHVETGQSIPVPEHDRYMSRSWRQGHSRLVVSRKKLTGTRRA